MRSLRARLLLWLLGPLSALLLLNLLASYWFAWRPARDAYDQSLANAALAIRERLGFDEGRLALDLPNAVEQVLRTDEHDVIYVAVRDATGTYVGGDPQLAGYGADDLAHEGPGFFDGSLHGKPVRVAVLAYPTPLGDAAIYVAETTVKRTRLRFEILTASTVTTLMLVVAGMAVAGFGVRRGLEPLERIRRAIVARSERDLGPVDAREVPLEVRPLVDGLNDLLGRLEQSAGAQRRFIANAAHQLRTPLAGLLAQVEAAEQSADAASLRHAMNQIRVTAGRTARLANQLLALARAEPGAARQGEFRRIDLATLLSREADHWVRAAFDRNLDVGFELAPAPVDGDGFLLTELARNLVDNAFQYAGGGRTVTVRCGVSAAADGSDAAFLEVEDDGPGIPEEMRPRVFERFFRPPGSEGPGSGLGLAIVHEIASAHGGTVSIGAGENGRGTRVSARFPAAAQAGAAVPGAAGRVPAGSVNGRPRGRRFAAGRGRTRRRPPRSR